MGHVWFYVTLWRRGSNAPVIIRCRHGQEDCVLYAACLLGFREGNIIVLGIIRQGLG